MISIKCNLISCAESYGGKINKQPPSHSQTGLLLAMKCPSQSSPLQMGCKLGKAFCNRPSGHIPMKATLTELLFNPLGVPQMFSPKQEPLRGYSLATFTLPDATSIHHADSLHRLLK